MTLQSALLTASSGLVAACVAFAADPPVPGDLKVMSFNVRYGTAKDGENHWSKGPQSGTSCFKR